MFSKPNRNKEPKTHENISKCFSLSLYTDFIDSLSKFLCVVNFFWENPRRSSAFRGAPWRYGTTRSLCGELSLWSGAHGREMTWFQPHILETPTHQLFNWDGSQWEIMFVFFLAIFFVVVVHVSALRAWHILRYISTAFLRLDSWSLDDTTPVWSCQQVVSRAWEVEKPWLKDEVFGSLDVVFSVGATNVARSRFAMEIKLTYWTIPAIIYPHLIFHKVAHEKKAQKMQEKMEEYLHPFERP